MKRQSDDAKAPLITFLHLPKRLVAPLFKETKEKRPTYSLSLARKKYACRLINKIYMYFTFLRSLISARNGSENRIFQRLLSPIPLYGLGEQPKSTILLSLANSYRKDLLHRIRLRTNEYGFLW